MNKLFGNSELLNWDKIETHKFRVTNISDEEVILNFKFHDFENNQEVSISQNLISNTHYDVDFLNDGIKEVTLTKILSNEVLTGKIYLFPDFINCVIENIKKFACVDCIDCNSKNIEKERFFEVLFIFISIADLNYLQSKFPFLSLFSPMLDKRKEVLGLNKERFIIEYSKECKWNCLPEEADCITC